MSKVKEVQESKVKDAVIETDFEGKTNEELKQAYENLAIQFQEHQRLAAQHSQQATKCQGALEVLSQLLPASEEDQVDG